MPNFSIVITIYNLYISKMRQGIGRKINANYHSFVFVTIRNKTFQINFKHLRCKHVLQTDAIFNSRVRYIKNSISLLYRKWHKFT